jgi:hypothetical protein
VWLEWSQEVCMIPVLLLVGLQLNAQVLNCLGRMEQAMREPHGPLMPPMS